MKTKMILSAVLAMAIYLSLIPMVVIAADAPSSWANDSITEAIEENLIPENLQSKYAQAITRAEFASLIVKLYEKLTGEEIAGRTKFSDTSDINVEKTAYLKIVNGTGDNKFSPNAKLTREQAATMLARLAEALGDPLPKKDVLFADKGKISSWALEAVGQVQGAGIMGGTGNNIFSPKGDYTREQSFTTIMRLRDIAEQVDNEEVTKLNENKIGYYARLTPDIPDFSSVTGVPLVNDVCMESNQVIYLYDRSKANDGKVQKYIDKLKELGFTHNIGELTDLERDIKYIIYDHPNKSTNVTMQVGAYNELYPGAFSISINKVEISPYPSYIMYKEFPNVPDFGAIMGIPLKKTVDKFDGSEVWAYYYSKQDLDAAAKKMGISDAYAYYIEILKENKYAPYLQYMWREGDVSSQTWHGYGFVVRQGSERETGGGEYIICVFPR